MDEYAGKPMANWRIGKLSNSERDGFLLELLKEKMPVDIKPEHALSFGGVALFVVDAINAFCTPGCGPLAPPASDPVIESTIHKIDTLARRFNSQCKSYKVIIRDAHSGREYPWETHALRGTAESQLVPSLAWLEQEFDPENDLLIEKDCINPWLGAEYPQPAGLCDRCGASYSSNLFNPLREFLISKDIKVAVVAGFCTDICVKALVNSLIDASNSGLIPQLKEVVVDVSACNTYDKPIETCRRLNLSEYKAHPRWPSHHLGLYGMPGAVLTERIVF